VRTRCPAEFDETKVHQNGLCRIMTNLILNQLVIVHDPCGVYLWRAWGIIKAYLFFHINTNSNDDVYHFLQVLGSFGNEILKNPNKLIIKNANFKFTCFSLDRPSVITIATTLESFLNRLMIMMDREILENYRCPKPMSIIWAIKFIAFPVSVPFPDSKSIFRSDFESLFHKVQR